MSHKPQISVIIPTKNVSHTIDRCLASLEAQRFQDFEIVLIDNFSTDLTKELVTENYPSVRFFEHGPERHTQRAFGVEQSRGKYLFFIDGDMHLEDTVLEQAVARMKRFPHCQALIIPERAWGADNFWTRCKILERNLYAGDDQIEAARFFRRSTYDELQGFDTTMIAMEDWDLTRRARLRNYRIGRIKALIFHNEGYVTLRNIWDKKRYYGQKSHGYIKKHGLRDVVAKIYFFRPVFWRNISTIFRDPRLGLGLVFLLTWELFAGALGVCFKPSK